MKYLLFISITFLFINCINTIDKKNTYQIVIKGKVTSNVLYKKHSAIRSSGKIYPIYYVILKISSGTEPVFYRGNPPATADLPQLRLLYKQNKITEMLYESVSGLKSDMDVFNNIKKGDTVIIRFPYWSLKRFLQKKSDFIQINTIQKQP